MVEEKFDNENEKCEFVMKSNRSKAIYKNQKINNDLSPKFVDFLSDKYMPYAFLWAGFVFSGMSQTRMTNGIMEGFKKTKNSHNVLPHAYLAKNAPFISVKTDEYLSHLKN
ncbi:unnamed protein product [Brachionus calyciflorus]|uniref:Uncharacterized protein n=1 Tax=Brachionus calyciflorus TaxID=104777 RepID=A0A814F4V4_9BILA|nr:unnamed protein product [Brachionus calyciflorus]